MIPKTLTNLLEKANVPYTACTHKKVYTAFDLATTLGERVERVAKAVLVKADRRMVVVVVPAHARLDFTKIAKALKAKRIALAKELELTKLKWKPGTTPPFGSLKKLDVVLDASLAKAKDMIVRTGSLTDSLTMRVKDFVKLESPIIAAVGVKGNPGAVKKKAKAVAKRPAKKRSPKRARTKA